MNYEKAAAAFIDAHREEMVQTLAEFVRIPSVRSAAKENMPYGEGFGTAAGQTTLGVVFLRYDGKNLAIGSDSRVSVGANAAELGETFRRGLPFKVEIKTIEPYAVPRGAPIVKRLQNIYKKYTGRTDPPYDMNAMTYMHMTQGGVIFGGVLYGDGSRNAHAADECYNLDTFVLAAKMFAAAILEVCGKEANDL